MPLRSLDRATDLIYQASGAWRHPPTVYLPGVHGDWTPLEQARPLLNRKLRLVETAYPRVANWTLEHFARSLEELMNQLGVQSAHLIAESFGSLVGWQFGLNFPERVRSLVLVGGFARPPRFGVAGVASRALRLMPTRRWETNGEPAD